MHRSCNCFWLAIVAACALGAASNELALGDAAWAARAEGAEGGRPRMAPILAAVDAYESALALDPDHDEARWKLLRALHFAGDFVSQDSARGRALFERACEVSEAGLDGLADRVGEGTRLEELDAEHLERRLASRGIAKADVARTYFWSAINWGAWSQRVGLLGAIRQGVANRVYRYTTLAIALEPTYDDGGPLRLLGRLHAELPRVPFVSSWVDRDQAIPLVERAYGIAPENPGNRLLLAVTLLELDPERRQQALDLLTEIETLDPRPSMRIEDLAMREQARVRIAATITGQP